MILASCVGLAAERPNVTFSGVGKATLLSYLDVSLCAVKHDKGHFHTLLGQPALSIKSVSIITDEVVSSLPPESGFAGCGVRLFVR